MHDTSARIRWSSPNGSILLSDMTAAKIRIFTFFLAVQILFSAAELSPADPFIEPFVGVTVDGNSAELGWPVVYAKCFYTEKDTVNSGPWTRIASMRILEISMVGIVANLAILIVTSFFGASLACYLGNRLNLKFSVGILFSILSVVALNLTTQNRWLIRLDAGLVEKSEYLIRSFFSYATWFCSYSVCFIFVIFYPVKDSPYSTRTPKD